MKNSILAFVSVVGLGLTTLSHAVTPEDAQAIKEGVNRAKAVVDRALAASGSQGGSHGGWDTGSSSPGSGPSPWEVGEEVILESDFVALPIYQQASNSLFAAGSLADQAIFALSGVNIQEGVFLYAKSCAKMGISRSQVARANLAALQPPVGYLAAFGPELEEVVVELNALHQRCL